MKNTIQNFAKAFGVKPFLELFVLLVLFIPLLIFAQSQETGNKVLPIEESFMEMWEKRIKNDSETIVFEKIEERKYHFKTNKFSFDDDLEVVSIEIEKNILKGCASEYTSARINLKFTGIPDVSEFRDEYHGIKSKYLENRNVIGYSDWDLNHTYFYYDYQAEKWLSEKEYSYQERECEKQISQMSFEDTIKNYFPEMLPFMHITKIIIPLLFLLMIVLKFIRFRNKNKDFKNYSNFFKDHHRKFSEVEIIKKSTNEIIIFISRKNRNLQKFLERRNIFLVIIAVIFCLIVLILLTIPSTFRPDKLIFIIIANIISGNMVSLIFWINLLGFMVNWFVILLFLLFIKHQLFGFNIIYVNSLKNKIIFYGSFMPSINKQESKLEKASIEMKNLVKTSGNKKLHLCLNEGNRNFERIIALAVRCNDNNKEKIYNALKKYIKVK
ncbi:MAG: hypothetical protein U9N04_03460 [Patescibacteria group bacterium]|nr:hypothetical protein [Patescibacteria group bacterium]